MSSYHQELITLFSKTQHTHTQAAATHCHNNTALTTHNIRSQKIARCEPNIASWQRLKIGTAHTQCGVLQGFSSTAIVNHHIRPHMARLNVDSLLKFGFIEYDMLKGRENYRFFSPSRDKEGSRLEEKLLVTVVVTGNYVMKLGNTKP